MKKERTIKVNVIGLRGFPAIQGGVEKHCEALYPRMQCKFRVFRRKPYLTTESYSHKYPQIEFSDLPSTRIKGFEAMFHSFLSVCHSILHRPDLVHIHNIGPGLLIPLLKLFHIPVVMTYHSPNYEHKKWGPIARGLLKLGEKLSLGFSDRIIFVNRTQMMKYPSKVIERSSWIANGVNREFRTEDKDYLEKLGITNEPYVLAVGRITPEKGFEYLVEAVNKVKKIKHVVIAGGSDHGSEYLEKLKRLDTENKIIFTGNLNGSPLQQLYSHASLFVLSSVNEGFPLVMLEAMNYGLPIIASRIPATEIPEILDCRKFNVADTNALAKKLDETFESMPPLVPYDLSDYNWETIATQTLKEYQKALQKI